jgi:hypothetical protein
VATRIASFASTIQDISNSLQLGLITSAKLAECLVTLMESASKTFEAEDYMDAKSYLQAFKNSVEQAGSVALESPSGQVLSEDADYLFTLFPNSSIYPIVNCVTNNGDGTYNASVGYINSNNICLTIPVGSYNLLSSPGQQPPVEFSPGTNGVSPYYSGGAASAVFTGSGYLLWTLRGPDGISRTATASSGSPACLSTGS